MNLLNKKVQISIWEFQKPRGVSQFVKNVWFENSSQIPSKMSKINYIFFFVFSHENLPFLCLPNDIWSHFDLFDWNLGFSDANMPFYMPFSNSKMSEFDPLGGGSAIFKNVLNSKKSELSEGGGSSLIEKFLSNSRPRPRLKV